MADTPARHVYTGNGNIRVFPIPTRIIGDDYVRIEIDGIHLIDRTQWDIVNNSVIFLTAPINGSEINIQVATSEEALSVLGSVTNVDIVADNMEDINDVVNSITNINTTATNIVNVNIVAGNSTNVNTVADNMNSVVMVVNDLTNINAVASNKTNIDIAASNITEIQNASANASIATTKALEASNSATSAYNSSVSAGNSSANASNSEIKANKWADNNYNVEVESGKYSAKHWATVSQNSIGVKVVENISSLKTFNINEANQIEVLGYYNKGDGGGGLFYWDATSTETDNGGTIIQATGITTGRWKRVFSGAVNVKWFGAKGDGVTDDTNAIQSASLYLYNIVFQDGEFVLSDTILLTQKHNIEFKNAKILYNGSSVAFDLYTDIGNEHDFENHPILMNFNIVGTSSALAGIRINSTLDVVIGNYESSGFTGSNASALILRNVAYGSFQGFCETYNIYGFASNFNTNGIKFEVDGGTTSFGYGYIQGKITPKIGTALSKSKVMDIQTTQLYNTSIDLSVWGNGYCDGIVIGNSTTSGRMYWCNIYIRGEAFNAENYSFDLTYGEIFGCTGFASLNNGLVKNPNNKRLEIYGQYQRTNYGNTTKQINGINTKLTPLMASFQVEDAFNGKPEAGFGIATGTNNSSPVIWMQNAVGNSFRVTKASFDTEPATDDYLLDVYYDGKVSAKEKFIAPKFASYETTFYATASTTTTQVLNVATLVGGSNLFGTYLVSANCYGANTHLSAAALITFSGASEDVICPVVQLISQDYNYGSIAIQTYGNIAANTYSVGNGRKCQVVITNGNASDMLVNLTITRIG